MLAGMPCCGGKSQRNGRRPPSRIATRRQCRAEASRPVIVAISACWNVRPGNISGTTGGAPALMLKAGEEGGADSTTEAIIAQARGTDSGPSEAASPTPADGAPTSDEGWNGHATRGWVPRMFTPIAIVLPSPCPRSGLSHSNSPSTLS